MPLPPTRFRALFATAILTAGIATAVAGTPVVSTADKTVIAPDNNPLCLFNDKLCFDFEERIRWENRENNYDFNSHLRSPNDGNWVQNRVRLGALWKPTDWLKIYAQGQDSREWNSNRDKIPGNLGAEGDDAFDLRQAYVEIGNSKDFPLVVKVGRQILSYGDERLIGSFDWNNFGRTFDAVKVSWKTPQWQLDAFASSVVVIDRAEFNTSDLFNANTNDRQQVFSGLYFTDGSLSIGSLELYALWLSQANGAVSNQESAVPFTTPTTGPTSKPSSFGTYGGRLHGDPKKLHGFEFDLEGAYQNGLLRGQQLDAFAVHSGLGYNFYDVPLKPRIWAEYNFASGDRSTTDNRSETFQNLFPTNHKFYGYMDLFSWQNMQNPTVSLQLTPVKNLTAEVAYRAYWLASTNDLWYRANGLTTVRPLTPATKNASNFVGTELDLLLTWKATKHLSFQGGFSHFFQGDYLSSSGGPSDDANFGFLMATVSY